jgi:hypothetical protein
MTRAELLQLFTPIYDEFAMMKFNAPPKTYDKVFFEVEDPTRQHLTDYTSGLGAWNVVQEDSDEGLDHFVTGYPLTLAQAKYRKYFYVSFEMNDQMEYAEMKKKIVNAEALGNGAITAVLKATSALIYGGFAGTTPDGAHVFDTVHPKNPEEAGILYSNLLAGPFSHDNLERAETQIAANYIDMDGDPITPPEKPILLYPPALNGQVMRVLSERANERPGTPNRDINIHAGKYIPVEWVYLGAAFGGSDTAWYIIYPSMQMLELVWGRKPQFTSWIENVKHRYYFDGWEHFVVGTKDWRFGFASTGL